MPYPRNLLTEGEAVVVELRPNWLFLGWPLVAGIAVLALVIVIEILVSNIPSAVDWILLVLVAVAALWFAARLLKWVTTSLVLTTNRIIERSGVLSRQGTEIRLERVNELSYRQTLLGRIFSEGYLMVEVGGETGVVPFEHINRPAAVQSLITQQITALRRRQTQPYQPPAYGPPATGPAYGPPATGPAYQGAPPPAPAPPGGSVAERLVQLDELRQRGILSEEEFNAKKAELLQQL